MTNRTITLPQENANDPSARLIEWLIPDGAWVEANTPVAVMETSKATFDVQSAEAGYLFHLRETDEVVAVGAALALVSESPTRPAYEEATHSKPSADESAGRIITKKARELMERHHLSESDVPDISVVRADDIERLLDQQRSVPFGDEKIGDSEEDWDDILKDETYQKIVKVLEVLRKRMKAKFNRHVSTGDILHDRWELAKSYGFGEGSSVYDSCLILGDVTLGKQCWVGPFTILDGRSASLVIGDYTSVGSGAQIYTHHTIEQALTAYKGKLISSPTRIGACCFISPLAVIAPGTTIGSHCFIAAGSYVEGSFPDYSYIEGGPASVVGHVEIKGDRAYLRRNKKSAVRE